MNFEQLDTIAQKGGIDDELAQVKAFLETRFDERDRVRARAEGLFRVEDVARSFIKALLDEFGDPKVDAKSPVGAAHVRKLTELIPITETRDDEPRYFVRAYEDTALEIGGRTHHGFEVVAGRQLSSTEVSDLQANSKQEMRLSRDVTGSLVYTTVLLATETVPWVLPSILESQRETEANVQLAELEDTLYDVTDTVTLLARAINNPELNISVESPVLTKLNALNDEALAARHTALSRSQVTA